METKGNICLKSRLFLTFEIEAVTGLHIGGATETIAIGGIDKTVIRDPFTNLPYIPGSSLRGKVRSLLEKYSGKEQNQRINIGYIHSCQTWEEYARCQVCHIFGVPGEREFGTPARLLVRDVKLTEASAEKMSHLETDFPYTEVKVEVAIDRVTAQANPRQIERVPAGAVFGPAEMMYSLYEGLFRFPIGKDQEQAMRINPRDDLDGFDELLSGLQLLEDDYLGAAGSRGSGKVRLLNLKLCIKYMEPYPSIPTPLGQPVHGSLGELREAWPGLKAGILARF